MDGNIYRAYMHLDNTAYLMLGKVCKGNIVSEKKGKSAVIILKIKALPHSLWKLVYKAENTLISTASLLVHKIGFKLKTYFIVFRLFYCYISCFAALASDFQIKLTVYLIEPVIQNIHNFVSVYGNKVLA